MFHEVIEKWGESPPNTIKRTSEDVLFIVFGGRGIMKKIYVNI